MNAFRFYKELLKPKNFVIFMLYKLNRKKSPHEKLYLKYI